MSNAIEEIRSRIIRIETGLHTLAEAQGINLNEKDKITVHSNGQVNIDALDVSFSNIIRAARQAGLHGQFVSVYHETVHVARFKV